MKSNRRIQTAIFLMLGVILFPALSLGIFSLLPKYYYSKATVEIKEADPAVAQRMLQAAIAPLGELGGYRVVPQTDLYELEDWDRDANVAADKANRAARTLSDAEEMRQKAVAKAANDAHVSEAQLMQLSIQPVRVKIWEKAEPASRPGRPNPGPFIIAGLGLGLISFVAGFILLLVGLLSRYKMVRLQPAGA